MEIAGQKGLHIEQKEQKPLLPLIHGDLQTRAEPFSGTMPVAQGQKRRGRAGNEFPIEPKQKEEVLQSSSGSRRGGDKVPTLPVARAPKPEDNEGGKESQSVANQGQIERHTREQVQELRSFIQRAASGDQEAIDRIAHVGDYYMQRSIQRRNSERVTISETVQQAAQQQLRKQLPQWSKRQARDEKFGSNRPYTNMYQFVQNLLNEENFRELYTQALQGDQTALSKITSKAEKGIQNYLGSESVNREDLVSQAKTILYSSLPGYLQTRIASPDFQYQNPITRIYAYGRSIGHSLIKDEESKQRAYENMLEPQPVHDITYAFHDFPVRGEDEKISDYTTRLEIFVENHDINIDGKLLGITDFRAQIIELFLKGFNSIQIAGQLDPGNIQSIMSTASAIRRAFRPALAKNGLLEINRYKEPPYGMKFHYDEKEAQDRCEVMEFMDERWFEAQWIQSFIENKGKILRRKT